MDIGVSVICVTYNQEKYIGKTIDSFLMQKTNFDYEIIIHDDASKDNTTKIIKKYEKKYPNKVKAIIEEENIFSQGKSILEYAAKQARGKYIAVCDGDDYWNDENKLQKQYDALENNDRCFACVHTVSTVCEDGTPFTQIKPSRKYGLKSGILTQKEFAELLFVKASTKCPFQTSCYFYRSEVFKEALSKNWASDRRRYYDANMLKLFLLYGDIYYIDETMSSYRINAVNSLSSASRENSKMRPSEMFNLINEDIKFDEYSNKKFHKYIMTEVYKYLLYAKETKMNEKENKELIRKYNLSSLGYIRYVGIKGLILHIFKDSYVLKKYIDITNK